MSQETTRRTGLFILFIAIAVGSVFGFLGGLVGTTLGGQLGFIALIIGSVLLFIGSIYGVFRIASGTKTMKEEREKKTLGNLIIWFVIAGISASGAIMTYFLGVKRIGRNPIIMIIIMVVLIALCLYSIFTLVSIIRKREETEITVETTSSTEKEI
jgi:hypothetical protein